MTHRRSIHYSMSSMRKLLHTSRRTAPMRTSHSWCRRLRG
jgi:hypothetical protein